MTNVPDSSMDPNLDLFVKAAMGKKNDRPGGSGRPQVNFFSRRLYHMQWPIQPSGFGHCRTYSVGSKETGDNTIEC